MPFFVPLYLVTDEIVSIIKKKGNLREKFKSMHNA